MQLEQFLHPRRIISVVLMVLGALASSSRAETPPIALAQDGQPKLTIYVVDPDAQLMKVPDRQSKKAVVIKASVEDLRVYLGKLTGAEFKVEMIPAYPGPGKPGIFVGLNKDLEFSRIDGSKQQYGLRTSEEQLLVAGADDRGISHGVYALLGQLGCRWYYPGDLWTVLPKAQSRLQVAADRVGGPDFYIQRRVWPGHGLRTPTTNRELADWQRRNGLAQPFDVVTAHSWAGLDPKKDFETHPEWFALVAGQRKISKPCYSHPQVIAKATEHALRHFEQDPSSEMVSLSAPDGLGFCTCELCKKQAKVAELFESNGVFFGKQSDGQEVSIASETIFNMANQVAKALAAKFPSKLIGMLAYSGYAHPPSFKLEPNIYVEVTAGYRRTPLTLPEQMTTFGQRASALGVYEYYDVEQWSWNQPGRAKAAQLDGVQASTRFYFNNNFRSLSGESSDNFGPNGIGYYAIVRLLWDAEQDVRKIEEEFYRDCFGPAAPPIQRLYRRWESGQGYDLRALALAYRDLDEAGRFVEGQGPYSDRVDRLKMYAHFLKLWVQPPGNYTATSNAAQTWAKSRETPEQRKKIEELGIWVSRLIDTHMVHHAFNRYLLAGAGAMGMDTSAWQRAGPIPSAQEIAEIFQKDLAELKRVDAKDVPAAVYSRELAPVTSARQQVPGAAPAAIRGPDSFRRATMELVAEADQTIHVEFATTGVDYGLLFTPREVYEDGGGSQYSTRIASGKLEGSELTFDAKDAGYYTLQFNDATIKQVNRPHALHAAQLQFGNGTFYFFVPKGTERFIIQANAHGGPTLTVADLAGRVVLDAKPSKEDPQTQFLIDVPKGGDGGVWKVVGPQCVNRTGSIRFIGLPPYLSLAPNLLMVPRETLP
jgi:hypothetical protein